MAAQLTKRHWMLLVVFAVGFVLLLAIRLDFNPFVSKAPLDPSLIAPERITAQDTWMQIELNNRKIGYAHSVLSTAETGFTLKETLFMKINILGVAQELQMATTADLKPDLSISSFDFSLRSARFDFTVTGSVAPGPEMHLDMTLAGTSREMTIPLEKPPYLTAGILYAAARDDRLNPGEKWSYPIFDPSTLQVQPVAVEVKETEPLSVMGKEINARKLAIDFKGTRQTAWLAPNGEVVREEGLLGMTLKKVSRKEALAGLEIDPAQDLAELAAVPVDQKLDNPRKITELVVDIQGIKFDSLDLNGGRQALSKNQLHIATENLTTIDGQTPEPGSQKFAAELAPGPFIQSDHPDIKQLSQKLTTAETTPLEKAKSLVSWVYKNIDKRPVLSVPDALSTLHNRMGDCNEHAMLLAALARAAGIPAEIEAGLVYLNGRFYYHAWNRLYVGEWITADAVFGQVPADATHIRLVSGGPEKQMDLMPVIDKIQLAIIDWK